ncbi:hypothetical protein Sjap_021821 [Stephania japonica]|uniref:Uncharacterized protein n=1 Tax=Stephania japonica TaxID=461633 RepID=A0AAP0EWH7_9MAGN
MMAVADSADGGRRMCSGCAGVVANVCGWMKKMTADSRGAWPKSPWSSPGSTGQHDQLTTLNGEGEARAPPLFSRGGEDSPPRRRPPPPTSCADRTRGILAAGRRVVALRPAVEEAAVGGRGGENHPSFPLLLMASSGGAPQWGPTCRLQRRRLERRPTTYGVCRGSTTFLGGGERKREALGVSKTSLDGRVRGLGFEVTPTIVRATTQSSILVRKLQGDFQRLEEKHEQLAELVGSYQMPPSSWQQQNNPSNLRGKKCKIFDWLCTNKLVGEGEIETDDLMYLVDDIPIEGGFIPEHVYFSDRSVVVVMHIVDVKNRLKPLDLLQVSVPGGSRPMKPVVFMKSIKFEQFVIQAGSNSIGVATDMVSMNSTVKLTFRNTVTFFGVHVTTPVELSYSQLKIASGTNSFLILLRVCSPKVDMH